MADYKLSSLGGVIFKERGLYIPADVNNPDWLDYQAWLALGHTPDAMGVDPIQVVDWDYILPDTVPINKGGTGLSSLPSQGTILIGKANNTYTQKVLRPGTGIDFDVSANEFTINSTASSSYSTSEIDTFLAAKASTSHTHSTSDITSGTFVLARLPVAASGTSSTSLLVRADDSRLNDSRTPLAHSHTSANISDFTEAVEDTVAGVLQQGANISITRNDAANTITISSTSVAPTVNDASTTSKGIIQLGGDIAGTATSPTVPGLVSKANNGANSDITSITGLTTPLALSQGGTGSNTKNFLDLTSVQTAEGDKTFSGNLIFTGTLSKPNTSKFRVYKNATQTLVLSTTTKVTYQVESFDTRTEFNLTNNRFIAQATGAYLMNVTFTAPALTASTRVIVFLYVNNVEHTRLFDSTFTNANPTTTNNSVVLTLTANDYVEVFTNISRAVTLPSGTSLNTFSGIRLT